jgi:hypothetical protein
LFQGILTMEISSVIYFRHLLDLTTSSYKKCNYRPSDRNWTSSFLVSKPDAKSPVVKKATISRPKTEPKEEITATKSVHGITTFLVRIFLFPLEHSYFQMDRSYFQWTILISNGPFLFPNGPFLFPMDHSYFQWTILISKWNILISK